MCLQVTEWWLIYQQHVVTALYSLCCRDVSNCNIATIAPMAFVGMKDLSRLYVWWLGGVMGRVIGRGDGKGDREG